MPGDVPLSRQNNILSERILGENLNSPDSEFDDALGVPDSLEIDENGQPVDILNEDAQDVPSNSQGRNFQTLKLSSRILEIRQSWKTKSPLFEQTQNYLRLDQVTLKKKLI